MPKISTVTFKTFKLSSVTFQDLSYTILSHLQKTYSYFPISSKNIGICCQMVVVPDCVQNHCNIAI